MAQMFEQALQLLASLHGAPIFTQCGNLYIGNTATSLKGVIGCATSNSRNLIAVITLEKLAIVFEVDEGHKLTQVARHAFPKRLTSVQLVVSDNVLISDAFGDVYLVPIEGEINMREEGLQERYRILGHFSTITDTAVHNGLLASGDRDGKIRISRLPESYVIEAFCLGHEEFISCLLWHKGRLVSGGGDGVIRVWDGGDEVCDVRVEGSEVTIGRVLECAWDENKLMFMVVGGDEVFEMCGKEVRVMRKFGGEVSGMEVGEEGMIWVSTGDKLFKMWDGGCEEWEMLIGEGDERMGMECSRLLWLSKQRKKEMIENWKGKKRRFGEV